MEPQKTLPKKTHPSGPCIPGSHRLFMDVDGNFYPCEKVSESSKLMKIGNINTGFDLNNIKKLLNVGKLNENSCKHCWAIRFCGICACLVDDGEKGFSKEKKEEFCKRAKLSLEETLKNYCFLKEFGYTFEEREKINVLKSEFEMGIMK